MAWTCPECNRTFKNTNQWHSCVSVNPDVHFKNKNIILKAVYEILIKELKSRIQFEIYALNNCIQLRTLSTFLRIIVNKESMELAFQLPYEVNEFPVAKSIRFSDKRYMHLVYIDSIENVDEQLINWLVVACELSA